MDIVLHLLSQSRIRIILGVVTGILGGLGNAVLIGWINTELHVSTLDVEYAPVLYGGFGLLVLATHMISVLIVMRVSLTVTRDLRMELSRRIIDAPLRLLQQLGTAKLMANLTEDIGFLVEAFQEIPHLFIHVSWVVGCLAYLCWLSWDLFAVVVLLILTGVIGYRLIASRAMIPLRHARELDDTLYAHFRGLIYGIKEIKLNQKRKAAFLSELLFPTAEACRQSNMTAMTLFIVATTAGTTTLYFLIGIILFGAGQWEGVTEQITTGYTLTILYMMAPLTAVIAALPVLGRASVALGKIDRLKTELGEQIDAADENQEKCLSTDPSVLELVNVTHRYRREGESHDFELGPLNLTFYPGELVFIVGGNGSGKSTMGLLLVGLYPPESGQIRLNHKRISTEDRDFYRQHFSTVFSDFYLFENLLGLAAEQQDDKIRAYLSQLRLDHKVSVSKGVFSTIELSQGQRKRLALLIAYLEDRPFYVFDEWASDQDPVFKTLFYTTLLNDLKARGKTVVVITHDDRYFHLADRCIRLENGKVTDAVPVQPLHAYTVYEPVPGKNVPAANASSVETKLNIPHSL